MTVDAREVAIARRQAAIFAQLWAELAPRLDRDRHLPGWIQQRLGRDRRFGSRDRRLYRELLYTAVRFRPWLEAIAHQDPARATAAAIWLAESTPATNRLAEAFLPGWPTTPDTLEAKALVLDQETAALLPAWAHELAPAATTPPALETLHRRAPLWVRLQTDTPETVLAAWREAGWNWRTHPSLTDAFALPPDCPVDRSSAYQRGQLEIQDIGSQLILAQANPGPIAGENWLDACAGAGGKTLQLARLVGPRGRVTAYDVRPAALDELANRAQRAGLGQIAVSKTEPRTLFDGVLVDAPCSGSGTWRRAPHLKWTTTATDITTAAQEQTAVLARYAARVRTGGKLIYATCSLCPAENEAVVAHFLAAQPDFKVRGEPGGLILPQQHDGDGFFAAYLQRQG